MGSHSPIPFFARPVISLTVYVDVKDKERKRKLTRAELRNCVKAEVVVLDSSSLTVLNMVSVDVKQHRQRTVALTSVDELT